MAQDEEASIKPFKTASAAQGGRPGTRTPGPRCAVTATATLNSEEVGSGVNAAPIQPALLPCRSIVAARAFDRTDEPAN